MRRRLLPAILAALLLAAFRQEVRAAYRADFFDLSHRPTVQFDKKTFTWTLRNQAVERVVRFDLNTGALQTTRIRDLKHGWTLPQAPAFEGSLSFAAPLIGVPAPVRAWKYSTATPPADWAKPDFDDASWKSGPIPSGQTIETKSVWYRFALPTGVRQETRGYAVLFDRALRGDAEIYVDGVSVQKLGAYEHAEHHLISVDVTAAAKVVAVRLTDADAPPVLTGNVSLGEEGSSPPAVELNQDWKYVLHSVNTNEDGSKILTVSLTGLKRYEGFDLDVYYQIYPGDEPFLLKWFTFTSHRATRFLLDEVRYDRYILPGTRPNLLSFPGSGLAASDPDTGSGVFSAVLAVSGNCERGPEGHTLSAVSRPGLAVRPNTPLDTPRSLTGLYRGPAETGAFLYQLYAGQYIARATPTSIPSRYNTWYGYQNNINATICEKIVPLAASLGVKMFVIDDGWASNAQPDSGAYGDWMSDRSPVKFPKGLLPVSLLVRANKMRFGLWTMPTTVGDKSQAALDHASWLLRRPGGEPVSYGLNALGMCFSSGWADNYTATFRDLCRELNVSYLKVDGSLFYDFCCDPAHDHPVGRAESAQVDSWIRFTEEMRKVTPDFIINRSTESGAEMTAQQDEGIFGDWEIGGDKQRMADTGWWYKNADLYRRTLYDLTGTRPPFTIEFETPCHIPSSAEDLNALEYHFTSVGAYICNAELQGKLDDMTPGEQGTIRKWVKWNEENRPWLAYTQPLPGLGQPWNPKDPADKPHVDGVLHLRNPLDGRYGYLCLWNPGDRANHPAVSFRPSDYLVRMPGAVEITRLKDSRPVKFTLQNGLLSLSDLEMAPHSWEIYEIRQTARTRKK